MLLLMVTVSLLASVTVSFSASQPQMVDPVINPPRPIPNLGVNVTCQVLDRYGLVNVSLCFSTNNAFFAVFLMQIVDGDYYNGTFLGQIPSQFEGTLVEYYVKAIDMLGYTAQTQKVSYIVSVDVTPPSVSDVIRVSPLGSPVLPDETVAIEAVLTDDGSGVKNATLHFGKGEDPYDMNFSSSPMFRISGDDYNCTFLGTIPHYPNGSRVYYFVSVADNAGNYEERPERYPYSVMEAKESSMSIVIDFLSIDMNNLTATLDVRIDAFLPSLDERSDVGISLSNGIGQGWFDSWKYLSVKSFPERGRFYYGDTFEWNVHLIGSPNYYPYDSYFLNFTFTSYWSEPTSLQFSESFFEDYRLFNVWSNPVVNETRSTIDDYDRPVMVATVLLERNSTSILPVTMLIVVLFFVLGATMFVEAKRGLRERVTVFLAILVFSAGFFFNLSSMVPFRFGFTTAEVLVLSLVFGSALLTIGSFFSKAINTDLKNSPIHTTGFANAVLRQSALIVDLGFTLLLIYFLWIFHAFDATPLLYSYLIYFGVVYALIYRLAMTILKEYRQKQHTYVRSLYE